jgi:hypothetical protein
VRFFDERIRPPRTERNDPFLPLSRPAALRSAPPYPTLPYPTLPNPITFAAGSDWCRQRMGVLRQSPAGGDDNCSAEVKHKDAMT